MAMDVTQQISCFRLAIWILIFAIQPVSTALSQENFGKFVDRMFRDETGDHKYVVFVPSGYRADKPSPAILFLHGAGERGHDNRMQLVVGLAPYVQARVRTFPFLVVFPQAEATEGRILDTWKSDQPGGKLAIGALDDARKHYNFDANRVVLTGWSMGGYGVWDLGLSYPGRWSALVPLSSGSDTTDVANLKGVPVWAFHGAQDPLVKPESGRNVVEAFSAAGGVAKFTELPNQGHDISDSVYGNDAVIGWMLNPKPATTQLGTVTVKPLPPISLPFVPALEIPQAIGVRLGNEVLDALAHSIPQNVSREMLSGQLNDMFDSTVTSGRQFSIRFSGISYNGQLERVVAKGWGPGTILVQVGVRNITLRIGGTSVTGARHSAQAGPIAISIGNRYPVWINLQLAPYIADRRIRLRLVSTGFQIPNDNWSVSQPAGISVRGFGMTEEAVSSGLTQGLYGAKGRIENEVVSVAPRIAAEIERNLLIPDLSSPMNQSESSFSAVWPLPMSAPRFQIWPEQISADEKGVSLIAGVTVANLDPFEPTKTLKRTNSGSAAISSRVSLPQVPADAAMHLVVSPSILGPLTEMYTADNKTRLDLLDIPEPLFTKMADRATLQEIIPDLKQYGDAVQVRSTMRFPKPVAVLDPKSADVSATQKPFEVKLPDIQITVSIRPTAGDVGWQPCAVFDLSLSEQLRPQLKKPFHDQRLIGLEWLPESTIKGTGKFAEGYVARDSQLDVDRYVELFRAGWEAYSAGLKTATAEMSDLPIGAAKLRMSDVRYSSSVVDATFRLARIKLTNLTEQPFTYQTKAPTSSWGESLTLKPGASHEFEIPYPLTYRRNLGTISEVYTLPVGSHSEFRVPVTGGAPRLFAARRL